MESVRKNESTSDVLKQSSRLTRRLKYVKFCAICRCSSLLIQAVFFFFFSFPALSFSLCPSFLKWLTFDSVCVMSAFVKGEDGKPAGQGGPVLSVNGPQLSWLGHWHRLPGVGDGGGGVWEGQGKSSGQVLLLRLNWSHANLLRASRPLRSVKTWWH